MTRSRKPTRAPFVARESCDGGGSTTQTDLLFARLLVEGDGHTVCPTHQPSDGPIGKFIRRWLGAPRMDDGFDTVIDPEAFQRLFVADRVDHLARVIEPARAAGHVVVCDRSELSTAIYYAAGLPVEDEDQAMTRAFAWHEGIEAPTLTVILVVPAEVAAERRAARGGAPELFEEAEFQARVAGLYASEAGQMVHERGIPWVRRRDADLLAGRPLIAGVAGTGSPEEVHARVWAIVEELLR